MTERTSKKERRTNETAVEVELNLDGRGQSAVSTGIGFLDHLLTSLARHGRFDLTLSCKGDIVVDDHHTAEDSALVLGSAIDEALGDRSGIARFGWAFAPMDEALARAVVDLSGRPFSDVNLGLTREKLGELSTENAAHVLRSLAVTSRASIHVDVLKGENDHHKAEAAFKALALAFRAAWQKADVRGIPSTKGVL